MGLQLDHHGRAFEVDLRVNNLPQIGVGTLEVFCTLAEGHAGDGVGGVSDDGNVVIAVPVAPVPDTIGPCQRHGPSIEGRMP